MIELLTHVRWVHRQTIRLGTTCLQAHEQVISPWTACPWAYEQVIGLWTVVYGPAAAFVASAMSMRSFNECL